MGGGEGAWFTPIGLSEIDGRQTAPEDGGAVDELRFQLIGGETETAAKTPK